MKKVFKNIAGILVIILITGLLGNFAYAESTSSLLYAENGAKIYISGGDNTLADKMVTILIAKNNPTSPIDIKWLWQTRADENGNYSIEAPVLTSDLHDVGGGDYAVKINADGSDVTNTFKEATVFGDMYTVNTKSSLEDSITLDIDITNIFSRHDEIKAVCAFYSSDDRLINVDIKDISISRKDYSDKIHFASTPDAAAYAKIFLWERLYSLYPIKESDIISFSSEKYTLMENPEPIFKNPGKGWVRYGIDNYGGPSSNPILAAKALDYAQTGYTRFEWASLEPQEGKYDFSQIDEAIEYWDSHGSKFAFGVVTLNGTSSQDASQTPKWVFDKGADYTLSTYTLDGSTGTVRVPVYDDPVYVEAFTNFIEALADRYDGDERVSFIDARIQGIYGEGHHYRLSEEGSLELLDSDGIVSFLKIFADNFKKTQIIAMLHDLLNDENQNIILDSVYTYCEENGIGVRHDGIMGDNTLFRNFARMYGVAPGVFETAPRYDMLVGVNDWSQAHWDPKLYMQSVYHANPSYLDLGQWTASTEKFIENEEHLIKMLTNKIGYHFVLDEVSLSSAKMGSILLETTWSNKGRNFLYEPCNVKFALLDKSLNPVSIEDTDFNPQSWEPQSQNSETATISFGDVESGEYMLAVGLFLNDGDNVPDYRIGNYGRTDSGWYVIANVKKTGSFYTFEEYIPELEPSQSGEAVSYEQIINGSFDSNNGRTLSGSTVSGGALKLVKASQEFYIKPENVYSLNFDYKSDKPITYTFTDESGNVVAEGTVSASSEWKNNSVKVDYYDPGYDYFGECYYSGRIKMEFSAANDANAFIDNVKIDSKTPYSTYKDETNLLCDYGMELADIGWSPRYGARIIRTKGTVKTGSYSGKIERSGGAFDAAQIDVYEILKENGPGTYRFEVWVKPDIGTFEQLTVTLRGCVEQGVYADEDVFGYGTVTMRGYDGWKKVSHEFTVSEERLANMHNAFADIFSSNTGDVRTKSIYFDDARLTKIN